MKLCAICFTFLLLGFYSLGQNTLVFQEFHHGRPKRELFNTGDRIKVAVKGEKGSLSGTITAITTSSFSVDDLIIPLSEVEAVYTDRGNHLTKSVGGALLIYSAGFSSLDIFNNTINGDTPIVKSAALLQSAITGGIGVFLLTFTRRRIVLNQRNRLYVINFEHPVLGY